MKAKETLLLPVSPYQTYSIELKSISDTLVDLDNRVYQETLYPGNVVNLSWTTQVINIGIGRLVDENNRPLPNAVLQNVVGIAITDDYVFFQAEIDQDTRTLEVQKGDFTCVAGFDNPLSTSTVLSMGNLVCR